MNFSLDFGYDQLSTDVDVETVGTGAEVVLSSTLLISARPISDKLIHNNRRFDSKGVSKVTNIKEHFNCLQ